MNALFSGLLMSEYIELDFQPSNIPSEYLEAIGLITLSSSHTEHVVEWGIASCAGIDVEKGMAVTTHMPGPLRDNVLRSLAEIAIEDLDALDELDNILDRLKTATVARNKYVHNSLCVEPKTGNVYLSTSQARGSVQTESIPVSPEDIKSAASEIYSLGLELLQFFISVRLQPIMPPDIRPRAHKTKAARKKRRKQKS